METAWQLQRASAPLPVLRTAGKGSLDCREGKDVGGGFLFFFVFLLA